MDILIMGGLCGAIAVTAVVVIIRELRHRND